jgi:hypothetical protein
MVRILKIFNSPLMKNFIPSSTSKRTKRKGGVKKINFSRMFLLAESKLSESRSGCGDLFSPKSLFRATVADASDVKLCLLIFRNF